VAWFGRLFPLGERVGGGAGTVRLCDTIWRVTGPDIAAGSKVKVVRADGAMLTVAAA